MKIYIGMDVHCKSTVFVAQNGDGKVIAQGRVPTTPDTKTQVDGLKSWEQGTSPFPYLRIFLNEAG